MKMHEVDGRRQERRPDREGMFYYENSSIFITRGMITNLRESSACAARRCLSYFRVLQWKSDNDRILRRRDSRVFSRIDKTDGSNSTGKWITTLIYPAKQLSRHGNPWSAGSKPSSWRWMNVPPPPQAPLLETQRRPARGSISKRCARW